MTTSISRVTPARLRRFRWAGEKAYRVMDYYFVIRYNRWDCGSVGDFLDHVLGGFAVPIDHDEERNPPTPGLPAIYSMVNLRGDERKYRLFYGETTIYTAIDPSHLITHLFWHINAEAIRQTGTFLLIHSGAIVSPAGAGVLLPATSGSGKTTLTAGLVKSGFGYLSDEAAAIDPLSGNMHAYPKALTMKDQSMLESLGCRLVRSEWASFTAEGRHVHPEELRADSVVQCPATIRLVVAPRYVKGATKEVTPMTRAETTAELLSHAMNGRRYGRRALAITARIAADARGYRLVSGDLDEAVAAVNDLLADAV